MEGRKINIKSILIQLGINIVASAIVSYIMYKTLMPKESSANKVKSTSTSNGSGGKTTPTTTSAENKG